MKTVHDIFALWPSPSVLARDLGLKRTSHGTLMKMRGSIPMRHWPALIEAARIRRIKGITYETLVAAHSNPKPCADADLPAVHSSVTA